MGKECLAWNSELRSSLNYWWFCGREKRREGKTGYETGLIRFGFKSDSSAGALVSVLCVSDHSFPRWYWAGMCTSSAQLEQRHSQQSTDQLRTQNCLSIQCARAADVEFVASMCSDASVRGGDSTWAGPKPVTAVLTCHDFVQKFDLASLRLLPPDAR